MSPESSSQESPSSSSALVVSEYFKNSRHFSIGDHSNFSTVHGGQIQHNHYSTEVKKRKFIVGTEEEEAEYGEFPEIKRGEITAIRNICRSNGRLYYDFEQRGFVGLLGQRTVVAGDVRIGGVASRCTVVQYSGPEAGELWKKDFRELGGIRCPENAQLVAINLSSIPMLILTGDLVPQADLMHRVGGVGREYLIALAKQMDCQMDCSLWLDTSRGVFCRGPEGPEWDVYGRFDFEDLPLDAELLKEDVLARYLASRFQDREVIEGLSLTWHGSTSPFIVNRPTIISTDKVDVVSVGPSGEWKEYRKSCLGEREELANGTTRFTLKRDGRRLELEVDWRQAISVWLAQAPSIFHTHGIFLEEDMDKYELVLPTTLTGTLSSSKTKRERRKECPPIHLFIPSLSTSIFWSFNLDGQHPITTNLCNYLGLPISLELGLCYEFSWPTGTHKFLQAYQIARGFDPNTTEFARRNRYRIHKITEQPFESRFEEINSYNLTETPPHSIQLEELDDIFLGALFDDVLPEDLAMNTTTQGCSLQKDFTGVPDTADIECTLPKDLKSVYPSETGDAIPREANFWSRFIPTFSWAALEGSDIHSAGF